MTGLVFSFCSAIEKVSDLLQIFPGFSLLGGIPQEISWVKGRHDLDALVVLKYATQFGNTFLHVQQVLHGGISEDDYDFGPDRGNLSKQKWFAHCHLVRSWGSIPWWPAAIDVTNQDLFTLEANRFDDLR